VDDDFWGVAFDGLRCAFGAEDVGEVTPDLEGGDGGVEGRTRELEGATDDCDSAVVALAQGGH
jgi:hypothetical protein